MSSLAFFLQPQNMMAAPRTGFIRHRTDRHASSQEPAQGTHHQVLRLTKKER